MASKPRNRHPSTRYLQSLREGKVRVRSMPTSVVRGLDHSLAHPLNSWRIAVLHLLTNQKQKAF